MLAEFIVIAMWIGIWMIVSLGMTMFIKLYQLIVPAKKYVNRPNFLQQWLQILLIVPLLMP